MSQSIIPYPGKPLQFLFRIPVQMHRLGLGWIVSLAPVMILSTRAANSRSTRHDCLEYRRHGSKVYVISTWNDRPEWYRNLRKEPDTATLKIGNRRYAAKASKVVDRDEAQRVLLMFRRGAPLLYDPFLSRMCNVDQVNLHTLAQIAEQVTIVRFDLQDAPLAVPGVPSDRFWVLPAILATGFVWSFSIDIRGRFRRTRSRKTPN
jgi:deazaflavin-dependent oxidoreductase (nitroreductase family)